jgi:hypothetical protein
MSQCRSASRADDDPDVGAERASPDTRRAPIGLSIVTRLETHVHRTLAIALILCSAAVVAQPADAPLRLRGTLQKIDPTSVVVTARDGRTVSVALAPDLIVTEVVAIDPAAIQSGTFVGTTAVPGADGTLSAVEVHVFAEAARGTGEGHRPWDLSPGSTMTNATVTTVTSGANDRTMTLRYKDGEKTIHVPNGVPIVTTKAADRSLLVAGAKVIVTEQMRSGQLVATRVLVGRDGFAPPM